MPAGEATTPIDAMMCAAFFHATAILLLLCATAAPGHASEECTLDSSGRVACIHGDSRGGEHSVDSDLVAAVRAAESGADYCVKSTDITNDIRRRYRGKGKYVDQGQGDLVTGTESMLANCVSHSKDMAESLGMVHQDLSQATAKVGCDLFISGENVAWFGGYSEDTDPAVQCMKQWEESPGHLDNIMRQKAGDYVAVGVYKDGTKWWCTQTFAMKGDGNCPLVGETSDTVAPVDPVPLYGTAAPTTGLPETTSPGMYAPAPTAGPTEAPTTTTAPTEAPTTSPATTEAPITTTAPSEAPVTNAGTVSPSEDSPDYAETIPPPTQADCPHNRGSDEDTELESPGASIETTAPTTTKVATPAPSTLAPSTTALLTEASVTDATPTNPQPSETYPSAPMYDEDTASENTAETSMCKKGLALTNELRKKYRGTGAYGDQGSGDLRIGTVSMLENAVTHSERMLGDYGFNHQDLRAASKDVGCDLFVSGENIGMFYGIDTDPVEQCVKQWEESKPHLDGIMRAEAGDLVVVGIFHNVNGNNEYWCTQLFAKNGDGNCPKVGEDVDGTAPVEPEPVFATTAPPATTEAPDDPPVTEIAITYPSETYGGPGNSQAPTYGESMDTSESEYCKKAADITNDIRRRYRGRGNYADQGQGDLVVGTQSMLDNAVSHCRKMANGFGLNHQDLGAASGTVGCDLFISAENIARTGTSADPAEACMKMWENSEGHLNNIMRAAEGDYVVVGVYNDGNQWWCTQTFAKNGGEENCPLVGGAADNISSGPLAKATDDYQTVAPATTAPATTPRRGGGGGRGMYGGGMYGGYRNNYYGMRRY